MNYTPDLRAGIAKAFRYAREEIQSGRQHYICHALWYAPGWPVGALAVVQQRMGASRSGVVTRPCGQAIGVKHYSLDEWLADRGIGDGARTRYNVRKYRLRWLDALIKEFE